MVSQSATWGGGGWRPPSLLHLSETSGQENAPWNVVSQVLKRKKSTANHTSPKHVFCMWLGQAVGS